MTNISKIWFLKNPIDLEHKQYVLMAFIRDAERDLKEGNLSPYYNKIKILISDLECYKTTNLVVSKLNKSENEELQNVNKYQSSDVRAIEINKIVEWSLNKLIELQKKFNISWRLIESSFNIYYLSDKKSKTSTGFLFVRYTGSDVVEIYQFKINKSNVSIKSYGYERNSYLEIMESLNEQNINYTFIVAESTMAFNTMKSSMPFLIKTLEKYLTTD